MRAPKQAGTTRFLMTVGIYAVMVGFLILQTAGAATITVAHFDDGKDDADGTCTLREAIRTANRGTAIDACELVGQEPGIAIELAAGTYKVDLSGDAPKENNSISGDLDIFADVTIRGVAAELTVIDGGRATSQERVFHIFSGLGVPVSVQLNDLTVTGGHEPGDKGGNISVEAADVSLIDVIVTGGRAIRGGGVDVAAGGMLLTRRAAIEENEAVGGLGLGGGIYTDGPSSQIEETLVARNRAATAGGLYTEARFLRIRDSQFLANEATGTAGEGVGCGGGVFLDGSLTDVGITRTLISGNAARLGGGICWAGAARQELSFSAIVNNRASENGGGVWAGQDVTVRHTTISGNTAAEGGGIYTLKAETLLDSVTIAANTGGGMFNEIAATAELSLFADNVGGNCTGVPTTGFLFNLDDGNTCAFPANDPATPNLVNTDPLLGPLADNGGGLPTHALLPGSPAIDAYDSTDRLNCQGSPDQRTYPRGYPTKVGDGSDGDYQCDIGAFEFNAPFIVDSVEDTVDANTVDGRCEDAAGNCTLRAAAMQASAIPFFNDIELGPSTYSLTIPDEGEDDTEASGDLDVAGGIRLRGAGQESTFINVSAGAGAMRILDIKANLQATKGPKTLLTELTDLTITGGEADEGGAVLARAPLRLTRVAFRQNRAMGDNGGAVSCHQSCRLTVADSVFVDNEATDSGGAIFHDGEGPLQLYGSTLTENDARFGGAIATTTVLHAQNATLSGNEASESAGAVFADGVVLDATTIVNNDAQQNAGALLAPGRSAIVNTIIAGNLVGAVPNSCTLTSNVGASLGGNLSDTSAEDCGFDAVSDIVLADPNLGPLANNGGLTPTHALLSGSAAMDAGDTERCTPVDQRGFLRPADGDRDGSSVCDIGAVEAQGADVGIGITAAPNPATVGSNITSTIVIENAGPEVAEAVVMMATLPTSFSSMSVSVTGADADCNTAANQETCEFGNLAPGAEVTVEITATADVAGSVTISAEVMSLTADGAAGNDIAEATVTVNAQGTGGGNPGGGGGSAGGGSGGGGGGATYLLPLVLVPLVLLRRYGIAIRRRRERLGLIAVALLAASLPAAHADPVTDLISFSANTTASASEVNDNFSTLANALNDNDARIASLEAADSAVRVEALEAEIAELKTALNNLAEINQYVTMEMVDGQPAIRFTGVNLQIVNGMDETATANGTGNLIVGYNEERVDGDPQCSIGVDPQNSSVITTESECRQAAGLWALNHRSGSHYAVVGIEANFTRWGGLVVGSRNTSNNIFASVSGGRNGAASGPWSSISAGSSNIATGLGSSVSGGGANRSTGRFASVTGGLANHASGRYASVSAGLYNTASGENSSIAGGRENFAGGGWSSVGGGTNNTAVGRFASVTGGSSNSAQGANASISGGQSNLAQGIGSSVSGGANNTAIGEASSVSGGDTRNALRDFNWAGGGLNQTN